MRKFSFNLLYKYVLILILSALLLGCKEFGVQGGKVDISFKGIERITVISPTSVKLFWTKDSKYLTYNIYQKGNNLPLSSSTFSEFTVTGLNPNTNYEFSVSGVGEGDVAEAFQQDFLPTETYRNFLGLEQSDLSVANSTRMNLEWASAGSNVSYEILFKKNTDTEWEVYDNLEASSSAVVSTAITSLLGGTEYCIRVRAKYLDNTFLPSDVDQPLICDITQTDLLGLPTIYAGSNVPGNYIWFNAVNGNTSFKIDIYDESDINTSIASSNTGVGEFRSSVFLSPLKYELFAIVIDPDSNVQARVELTYSNPDQLDLRVRNFYDDPTFGAVHPPLMNDGKGVQRLGEQIVSGDFNCDGLKDLAVSAPLASPVENEDLIYETGSVIIYYSYDPPFDNVTATDPPPYLKTDVAPAANAVFPNPHLIHFPLSTGTRLGSKLEVGNFNGDCFYRDLANPVGGSCNSLYETHKASPLELAKIKKCDDIVMAGTATSRQVFAAFGDPLSGIVSGSGGVNYGIDEYTCDAASSSCRSVQLTNPTSNVRFGMDLASGDFNNDGYDDLVITGKRILSGNDIRSVYVLRGANQGITPIGHINSFPIIETNNASIFPVDPPTEADGFADSVSAFYNSRECQQGAGFEYRKEGPTQGYGYDFTKCDDLVIGAPNRASDRGSIYTCKAVLPVKDSVSDDEKITDWQCAEHYPTDLGVEQAHYGFSLLSVPNQNGYPLEDSKIFDVGFPDVTGALFVGAPGKKESSLSSAGAVYAYYLTPSGDDHGTGGIQGLLTLTPAHTITAINSVACDAKNTSCENQKLVNSPPQSGAEFGYSLSTIENLSGSTELPYLAISAPFRNIPSADGASQIIDAGSVFLYGPDVSTFGIDNSLPVAVPQRGSNSPVCTVNCTWYSGGVSPFGPVVIYPDSLGPNNYFGASGSVGGDFNADGFGDLFSSAYEFSDPIESNGGVFGFFSNDGNFSAVEKNVDLLINENISKELNYRFENVKIVGDVNGDGYDDAITKIEVGTKVTSILYYGGSNGLIKSADPSVSSIGLNPKILFNSSDSEMGRSFYKVGSVNCDAFDDILLFGTRGAYIYYGSSTGIVASAQPSTLPIGKNPLHFGRFSWEENIIQLNYPQLQNGQDDSAYDSSNQSVGYGDFNADTCNDIAIGIRPNYNFSAVTDSGDIAELSLDPSNNYSATNSGRVVVIYGGSSGLQIGNSSGLIQLSTAGGFKGNVVANDPCNAGVCDIQLISSPGPSLVPSQNGVSFGYDIVGISSLGEPANELSSELLIADPEENNRNGVVYVYEGSISGLKNVFYQALRPNLFTAANTLNFDNEQFGRNIASAGDINGDSYPDVAVASPGGANTKGHVYFFYGGQVGANYAFLGETGLGNGDFWRSTSLNVNQKYTDPLQPKPQILQPVNLDNTDLFGNGLAGVGDFDIDGFSDVLVNVPLGDYLQEVNLQDAGMTILYFGSSLGVQISQEESLSPKCIYSDQPEECAPFQLHLPSRNLKERNYISQSCSGDINGDGVVDIAVGARGRHHPSGKATATGVFYIMY